jgi:diketogulonate reductase-like aldo/keto reductase
MVRISKRRRRNKANPFRWFGVAILLSVIGFTGTLTFMNQKSGDDKEGVVVKSSLVDAYSASKILKNGLPYLVYGTAWKKDESARLVQEAIQHGFRFIDTAGQPKHYNEGGVGDGIVAAIQELSLSRDDLWIQTKFSPIGGQDPTNIPYDPDADVEDQVLQSFEVSLKNLKTKYVDSLVLHSPYRTMEDTMKAWRIFEQLVDEGKVLQIGISNCYDIQVFQDLYGAARIKPAVLQNRFYSDSGFDIALREFCAEKGVIYQSFWTLTASRQALARPEIAKMAAGKDLTPQTLMYAFMMSMGHTPLDGTTSKVHMMEDIAVMERIQSEEEIFNQSEMEEIAFLLGITK